MEEPKNLKPGKRRVSDVIDSIGDCLSSTNDDRIVSSPENIIRTRGPDSPVSFRYGSVESGTQKSSVSPDSDACPSSPKKFLKTQQVDVTDASRMSQDTGSSSRYNKILCHCIHAERCQSFIGTKFGPHMWCRRGGAVLLKRVLKFSKR